MTSRVKTKPPKVLILGLGRYPQGSGVSAALYFARQKADVLVTDLKTAKDLKDNVAQLKKFKNVRFRMGKNLVSDIDWADVVVKNPDIRRNSELYKRALQLNKPIINDITVFLEKSPCPVIGITGTRGKSTTTTWITDMLKQSGKSVYIGGNITVSPLTFLYKLKKTDIAVVELSSWLLETCGQNGLSPNIAVWTNVMNDHLNTYDGLDDYIEAKAQIMRNQKPDDIFIPNLDDDRVSSYIFDAPAKVLGFSLKRKSKSAAWISHGWIVLKKGSAIQKVLKAKDIRLSGEHNLSNALAAVVASSTAGANIAGIRKSLKTFSGIPYRQQIVAVKQGLTFVNDTTATTPDAASAALKRFASKNNRIHWICGGAEKSLPYEDLMKLVKKMQPDTHVLIGTAFDRFTKALEKQKIKYQKAESLKQAFERAVQSAKPGDIILLSPACASFGLFKNEFDRGNQFNNLVEKL